LAPISGSDIFTALKHLRTSKSVEVDNNPGFVIKGFTVIPVLEHIFNLSLAQQYFPILWKQAAIDPVFKNRQQCFC
jgi:hypothetical protein